MDIIILLIAALISLGVTALMYYGGSYVRGVVDDKKSDSEPKTLPIDRFKSFDSEGGVFFLSLASVISEFLWLPIVFFMGLCRFDFGRLIKIFSMVIAGAVAILLALWLFSPNAFHAAKAALFFGDWF